MTELAWSNGTAQWAHTNVWGAGQLLATYSADPDPPQNVQGILNFYVDDPLGTRRVMTDYAGNVMEACHSLPYGNGEDCAASPTEHLFTQKERDAETDWPEPSFPHRTGYDFRIQDGAAWLDENFQPVIQPANDGEGVSLKDLVALPFTCAYF